MIGCNLCVRVLQSIVIFARCALFLRGALPRRRNACAVDLPVLQPLLRVRLHLRALCDLLMVSQQLSGYSKSAPFFCFVPRTYKALHLPYAAILLIVLVSCRVHDLPRYSPHPFQATTACFDSRFGSPTLRP